MTSTPTRRHAGWLVLPAVVPVVSVLAVGIGTAVAQSLGLLPLVGEPRLSLAAYRDVTTTGAVLDGLRISVMLAAVSTAIALIVGFTTAVLVTRSRLGGRVVAALAAATVPIPHVVGAAAIGLLLADSGLVARVAGAEPGTFPPLVASPLWLAVIAEYAWKESAFVAIVVLGALAGTEPKLDEAAAVLGAGPWHRVLCVSLPLAGPALVVAGSISFAYVVGSYEVAWLLGRSYPEPLPVLAFRLFGDTDLGSRPEAMAVAAVTVGVATVALVLGGLLLARVTRHR